MSGLRGSRGIADIGCRASYSRRNVKKLLGRLFRMHLQEMGNDQRARRNKKRREKKERTAMRGKRGQGEMGKYDFK